MIKLSEEEINYTDRLLKFMPWDKVTLNKDFHNKWPNLKNIQWIIDSKFNWWYYILFKWKGNYHFYIYHLDKVYTVKEKNLVDIYWKRQELISKRIAYVLIFILIILITITITLWTS